MPSTVRAGLVATVVSGLPSTTWALATGRDPLAAARAAATVIPGRTRPGLAGGIVAHVAVSAVWTAVFAVASRVRPTTTATGAVGGVAIAALDLGLIAPRWFPAIADLDRAPQLLDHIVFGAVVGQMMSGGAASAEG